MRPAPWWLGTPKPPLSPGGGTHHLAGMNLDLTDEETAALTKHLRQAIDEDHFPLAPRHAPIRLILAKLDPQEAGSDPMPLPTSAPCREQSR